MWPVVFFLTTHPVFYVNNLQDPVKLIQTLGNINSDLCGHLWSTRDGRLLPEAKEQVELQALGSECTMANESDIKVGVYSGGYES